MPGTGRIYGPVVASGNSAPASDTEVISKRLGIHLVVELQGCDPARLNDVEFLRAGLRASAEAGGLSVVTIEMHAFAPHGVTGVALLAESHISIHTWPELGYAAVDVFSCSGDPRGAADALKAHIGAKHSLVRQVDRGLARTS